MSRRRHAVLALRHAARRGDFRADLRRRQHAAMTGLRALRELQLDHLHLRIARVLDEAFVAEAAVVVAAAEIAGADFPHQIAAEFAVIRRNRTFAGIVIEPAALSAVVQRANRVRRQRAEAHRRDIEHAGIVRLRRLRADANAKIGRWNFARHHRMVDPFVFVAVDIDLRTERPRVVHRLSRADRPRRAAAASTASRRCRIR